MLSFLPGWSHIGRPKFSNIPAGCGRSKTFPLAGGNYIVTHDVTEAGNSFLGLQ